MTGKELYRHMKTTLNDPDLHDTFQQRLSELEEMGIVIDLGKRECTITGQMAHSWDVTSKYPIKPTKRLNLCQQKINKALSEEREACAAIAFETGDIVGAIIGNKIRSRATDVD